MNTSYHLLVSAITLGADQIGNYIYALYYFKEEYLLYRICLGLVGFRSTGVDGNSGQRT